MSVGPTPLEGEPVAKPVKFGTGDKGRKSAGSTSFNFGANKKPRRRGGKGGGS